MGPKSLRKQRVMDPMIFPTLRQRTRYGAKEINEAVNAHGNAQEIFRIYRRGFGAKVLRDHSKTRKWTKIEKPISQIANLAA